MRIPLIIFTISVLCIGIAFAAPPIPAKQFAHVATENGTISATNQNSTITVIGGNTTHVYNHNGEVEVYTTGSGNVTTSTGTTQAIPYYTGTTTIAPTPLLWDSLRFQLYPTTSISLGSNTHPFQEIFASIYATNTINTINTNTLGINVGSTHGYLVGAGPGVLQLGTEATYFSNLYSALASFNILQSMNSTTINLQSNLTNITPLTDDFTSIGTANMRMHNIFATNLNGTIIDQGPNQVVDTITGSTPITTSKTGGTYTISCTTCLTSAITSLDANSNPAQTLGATSPIQLTDAGATHTYSCPTCSTITTTLNTFSGSINFNRGTVSNMSQVINNSNTISYQLKNDIVLINGSAQHITKPLTVDSLVATLAGILNVAGNSVNNNGHVITWPSNSGPIRLQNMTALVNYTTPSNPATTTSTTGVMSNLFATFTPTTTGNIYIEFCGNMFSGTAGDGAGFDIRYGTSLISEGTAIGNTKVGTEQIITASTASRNQHACSVGYVTGLTLNQKYVFQIGKYAVTGGTASFNNFESYIEEK